MRCLKPFVCLGLAAGGVSGGGGATPKSPGPTGGVVFWLGWGPGLGEGAVGGGWGIVGGEPDARECGGPGERGGRRGRGIGDKGGGDGGRRAQCRRRVESGDCRGLL